MRVTDEEFLTLVRCFTPEVADASQASCPTSELGESRTCVSHAVLVQSGASIRFPPAPKLPIGPIMTQHRSA